MKPELAESLFVEQLYSESSLKNKIPAEKIAGITKLTGDASTRRYYRLITESGPNYVVCLDEPTDRPISSYPFFAIHKYLENLKIQVPTLYDIDLNKGYLLEEDLGDQTLLMRLGLINDLDEEYQLYKKAIEILLQMHSDNTLLYNEKIIYGRAFDKQKLLYEFEFTFDYFLKKHLKSKISRTEKAFLIDSFTDISEKIASFPMVFTHRDFHSRNIMVKDENLFLIDFQDARLGLPQYDLVSLLEDCYYDIDIENKRKLIKLYWDNLNIPSQDSFDRFTYLYDLMAFQRVFKAIGSFSYILHHRRDKRYIRHIGFGMEKIRSILIKYPEYTPLRKLLLSLYYGN